MKLHLKYTPYILCFLFIAITCHAQDRKPKRHLIELGGGGSFFLSPLRSDNPTSLLSHKQRNVIQFSMKYTYFFSYHWGIYADLQAVGSGQKEIDFYQKYIAPYESTYYIQSHWESQRENTILANATIGFAYRQYWKKWSMRPRLGIGFAETQTAHLNFTLKGKDNNEVRLITYHSPYEKETLGILSAGMTMSYHFTRRISIFTDINFLQAYKKKSSTIYEKDLYDDSILRKEKNRAPLQSNVHVSAGIGIHL